MAKLNDDEQRAIIGSRLSSSLGSDTALRSDRVKALDAYFGRPMGNELEGRAQVVTKDIMDVIEWMMPSLLRVFATKDAVQFDPVGPEDEELAKQETAYVSHVLWKKNPGFMLIYNWIKDSLMQKVGYVKYWWEKEEKVTYDEYEGLTEDQLVEVVTTLQAEGELDIVGVEQDDEGHYKVSLKLKRKYGCAKIDVIPADEVIVAASCRGQIKSAKFVGHLRRNITRSDLLEMGYSKTQVKALTSYELPKEYAEALARDTVGESTLDNDEGVDWATFELTLLECYTYIDADDDGIAELRMYLMGGNDILENKVAPEIPFESWTPVPVPHRHVGLSVYDLMEDLQRINTALNRGLLDNVYFTMNPRVVYDQNTVDLRTLQINRPGGHVANKGSPAGAVVPMPVQPMAGQILPVIDYVSQVRETRTGVGRMTSGVDADVLAQSTKGAYTDAKSAANQRIEAIARIFAETGLSSLYSSIHRLLCRHQDWTAKFKLKGQWIDANPTEWQERANLTVSVGLGNSSRDEVRNNLTFMGTAQQQAAQIPGLIQPKNVFALFRRMQTEMGFEQDDFITDPKSPEYQQFIAKQSQPPPDPYVIGKQMDAQAKSQGQQIDAQIKLRGQDLDQAAKITDMELKYGIDLAKTGIGAEVATHDRIHEGQQAHLDRAHQAQQSELDRRAAQDQGDSSGAAAEQ